MRTARTRAAALKHLGQKLRQEYAEAVKAVEGFCDRVRRYNRLEVHERQAISIQLQGLAGRRRSRRIDEPIDYRKTVRDLLVNPAMWIGALRRQEAIERLGDVPATAGRLVYELFTDEMLKGVSHLVIALTCADLAPEPMTGNESWNNATRAQGHWAKLWISVVIPAAMQDFPEQFKREPGEEGFEVLRDSWVTCMVLAEATGHIPSGPRQRKGQPAKSDPLKDNKLSDDWTKYRRVRGPSATLELFIADMNLGIGKETLKLALDRHRKR